MKETSLGDATWAALLLTLKLSLVSSLALMLVAAPLAWWVARSKSRFTSFVESVITLPLVLPPTVIGFYLLLALSQNSLLGRLWVDLGGAPLPFTFTGLVIASVVYSLPFAVQPMVQAFSRPAFVRYLQSAGVLGVSRPEIFFRVVWPLSMDGIAQAFVLTFAHTIGEFGVVLMLGGNIPGETKVVSIAVFEAVELADFQSAHQMSLILIGISAIALTIIYALRRRGRRYESD
jgi:molybdate transport system permease protein